MQLYKIAENFTNLMDLMDIPDIPEELLRESLEKVEGEFTVKAENLAKLIRNIEADARSLRDEEIRLATRRRGYENKVDSIKSYLEGSMRVTGLTKIKGNLFTLAIQKNPPSVAIGNMDMIPMKYLVLQEPKFDKKQILADLKAGEDVPGCEIVQGESLRIR